jgi:hypothetical protein
LAACAIKLGTFADALQVERNVTITKNASQPATFTSRVGTVDWYAPGVGLIKRTVTDATEPYNPETDSFELIGSLLGGVGRGVVPLDMIADGLQPADANTSDPDRPAIASDGTHFLVVQALSDGELQEILVGPDGGNLKSASLAQGPSPARSPAVTYGDGVYLVAYSVESGPLRGLMVSPDGTAQVAFEISPKSDWGASVAYGGGAFLVANIQAGSLWVTSVSKQGVVLGEVQPYPGQTQKSPSIASDGRDFLAVWANVTTELPNAEATHISAGRVNADGNAIDVAITQVSAAPGVEEDPDVTFDGAQYVVAWFRRPEPSLLDEGTVSAARIGTDGVLLDPGGQAISGTNTPKQHPRVGRVGTQALVVWEVGISGAGAHIVGTRIGADGMPLDTSATDDGLWISAQPQGIGSGAVMPDVGFGGDRSLVVCLERSYPSTQGWQIDATLVFPW